MLEDYFDIPVLVHIGSRYACRLLAADRSVGFRSHAKLQSVVRSVLETDVMEPPQRLNRPFSSDRDGTEVASPGVHGVWRNAGFVGLGGVISVMPADLGLSRLTDRASFKRRLPKSDAVRAFGMRPILLST